MKFFNLEKYSREGDSADEHKKESSGTSGFDQPSLQFEEIVPKAEREARAKRREREKRETASRSLVTMAVSAVLVLIAVIFAFGFKNIIGRIDENKPAAETSTASTQSQETASEKEYLKLSRQFNPTYVMVCNLSGETITGDLVPDVEDVSSITLANGEIYYAEQKGTYNGSSYFRLADELHDDTNLFYVKDNPNYIVPLKEYTEMTGYIVITYVSSTGVRIREWADYDADNVIGSAYVGDKIEVVGKVTTMKDETAFLTEKGTFITTDTRYLKDYTKPVGVEVPATTEHES